MCQHSCCWVVILLFCFFALLLKLFILKSSCEQFALMLCKKSDHEQITIVAFNQRVTMSDSLSSSFKKEQCE